MPDKDTPREKSDPGKERESKIKERKGEERRMYPEAVRALVASRRKWPRRL